MKSGIGAWPALYRITPSDIAPHQWDELTGLVYASAALPCIVQLRLPMWSLQQVRDIAEVVSAGPLARNIHLMINADIAGARAIDRCGVHLKSAQLMAASTRPLPADRPVAASCHNAAELDHAAALGLDFVTLSPVARTQSHPGAPPMGWRRFRDLVRACPLPIYALGGMSPNHLAVAVTHGAHGVAGIRGFWAPRSPEAPCETGEI
ncbi:thiamine phosphate synthase [Rhodococcus marinonascens]|uniref:thiamine phosphate synthase n=1 Tax=Rhodococcus marinonascens TaxID=38311 RepID=UPI00093432A8|nr:thiamine phosphate synthase [Rhodococcus marinonascens]